MSKKDKSIQHIQAPKDKTVRMNALLHNRIADISNSRRRNFSVTMRLLLNMGLDEYERNQKAGIDTTVKRKQNKAKQDAEAMAKAAERERRKNLKKSDTITAVTPMLFRPDDEE